MSADCGDRSGGQRRGAIAIIAVFLLALLVAALVKRAPFDAAALPLIATVRDDSGASLWAIRLAPGSRAIVIDPLAATAAPQDRAYQLWLATPSGPRSLGLLPSAGRKTVAEIPDVAASLAGRGELLVTLEPARGAETASPSGPVVFRTALAGGG